jgi:hypothetical protein
VTRSQAARLRRFEEVASAFNFAEVVAFNRERVEAKHVRALLLSAKALLEEAPLFEEIVLARDAHRSFACEAVETREDLEDLLARARVVVLARPRAVAMPAPAGRDGFGARGRRARNLGLMTSASTWERGMGTDG